MGTAICSSTSWINCEQNNQWACEWCQMQTRLFRIEVQPIPNGNLSRHCYEAWTSAESIYATSHIHFDLHLLFGNHVCHLQQIGKTFPYCTKWKRLVGHRIDHSHRSRMKAKMMTTNVYQRYMQRDGSVVFNLWTSLGRTQIKWIQNNLKWIINHWNEHCSSRIPFSGVGPQLSFIQITNYRNLKKLLPNWLMQKTM